MEQVCPRCKTTSYRNPNMKLMVNVCGHAICENCVELLFVKGSGSCPECGIPLRRANFRLQLFEDASVDKEVDIRRRILKDFNKQEEDFESLREYNDYLEMVEDIIFNLTHNIESLETNKKIQQYKEENRSQIIKNRSKMSKDALELMDILSMEEKQQNQVRVEMRMLEEAEKAIKLKNKEKLIDDLMFSEEDATKILAEHRETVAREERAKAMFSTGLDQESKSSTVTAVPTQDEIFVYEEPTMDMMGPLPPQMDELAGYLKNIRAASVGERAGGYQESLGCFRALQEAMAGLYYVPS